MKLALIDTEGVGIHFCEVPIRILSATRKIFLKTRK